MMMMMIMMMMMMMVMTIMISLAGTDSPERGADRRLGDARAMHEHRVLAARLIRIDWYLINLFIHLIYTHLSLSLYLSLSLHICMYVCMYIYIYIYICIYIYIYIYICIHIHFSLSLYIYIYIYICNIRAITMSIILTHHIYCMSIVCWARARRRPAESLHWAVIFMPITLPKRVLQTSYCTHFFCGHVLQTVLGMGMGMMSQPIGAVFCTYPRSIQLHFWNSSISVCSFCNYFVCSFCCTDNSFWNSAASSQAGCQGLSLPGTSGGLCFRGSLV